jgi:uncharacterized membrane protein
MSGHPDRKARLRALVVVILVPLVMAVAFGGIFWAKAVRTVAQLDSPQGTWIATIRVVNPGSSAGYSTHVVVARSYFWWPSRKTKVFVADNADGAVPLGSTGELAVTLRWEDDEHLVISYPARARVYRQEKTMGPVAIRYETR